MAHEDKVTSDLWVALLEVEKIPRVSVRKDLYEKTLEYCAGKLGYELERKE